MSPTAEHAPPAGVRETKPTDDRTALDDAIADAVRQKLAEEGRDPCGFYFHEVQCECCNGVLKLEGRVPTYRLKRLLLSLIDDLDCATEINDRLDVVSSTGLSSVRPK